MGAANAAQQAAWVERARGALSEMEELVSAFLWLARVPDRDRELEPLAVEPQLRRLLSEAPPAGPELRLETRGDPVVRAPASVLRIVLGNLLRNARAHAHAGPVELCIEAAAVEFINPLGSGLEGGAPALGFGFGLEIVQDLCRRFGWRLCLGPAPGPCFRARVDFGPPPASVQKP